MPRRFSRAIAALIVHKDDGEWARIILQQQRGDGLADTFGLVTRGNDGGDRRPCRWRRAAVIAFGSEPEAAAPRNEIQPYCERGCG
jgi:hypothetical protein